MQKEQTVQKFSKTERRECHSIPRSSDKHDSVLEGSKAEIIAVDPNRGRVKIKYNETLIYVLL